jgi:hypothetical protein
MAQEGQQEHGAPQLGIALESCDVDFRKGHHSPADAAADEQTRDFRRALFELLEALG